MKKKKLVVLSGAGISAESGIQTFRDSNGLWENHRVEDVASPQGWKKNPEMVLEFYNQRRRNVKGVHPNKAHKLIGQLEEFYDVEIVTQNIDNLHERGGSTQVLHIHGEILKSRSSSNPHIKYDQPGDIKMGDKASDGAQLRPDIVWFGEDVPLLTKAASIVSKANILLVIGTSMQVYPAAGLVHEIPDHCLLIVINPDEVEFNFGERAVLIKEKATNGMELLFEQLVNEKKS
jgi:NAD-dependent deacetylase